MTDRELYDLHLAKGASPEFQRLLARINYGGACAEDLIVYARWELREAMYSLPPDPSDSRPRGRPVDGFHAGCCCMRADSALTQLSKLITSGGQVTAKGDHGPLW